MTDKELMQQALNALEWCYDVTEWPANGKSAQDKAIEALRTRLTQPEPDDGYCQACDGDSCTAKEGCVARDNPPPQREWQGLTDEEMRSLWDDHVVPMFGRKHMNPIVFGRIIEAKLKEKNGY